LGKFHADSFKTKRLVCVEADGRTDGRMNGYTERWTDDANFLLESVYPLLRVKKDGGGKTGPGADTFQLVLLLSIFIYSCSQKAIRTPAPGTEQPPGAKGWASRGQDELQCS